MATIDIGLSSGGVNDLRSVVKALDDMADTSVRVGRSVAELNTAYAGLASGTKAAANALRSVVANAEAEQKAHQAASNAIKSHRTELQSLTRESANAHAAMRGLAGASGNLWLTYGNMAPMIAGFAAAASTLKSVNMGSEFDKVARSIEYFSRDLAGGTASVNQIKKELLSITDIPVGSTELAKGMQEFARAGVSQADALKNIREAALFSTNAEMELGKAIEFVVGQVNAFEGVDLAGVMNATARVASDTATNIQGVAESMKYMTAMGTTFGTEYRQALAMVGVMAQYGQTKSMAGTQLMQMMQSLARPTKAALEAMDQFQVKFKAIDDAAGKVKQPLQLLNDLEKATRHLNEGQKTVLFGVMTEARAGRALGIMTKDMANGAKIMTRELQNIDEALKNAGTSASELNKWWSAMSNSGAMQLKVLGADIERLFIKSYDNSSFVNALKEMQKVVNADATVAAIRSISTAMLELATLAAKTVVFTVNLVADEGKITAVGSALEKLIYIAGAGLSIKGVSSLVVGLSNVAKGAEAATGAMYALQAAGLLALSAFAGWQVGTWLSENFETARLAGIALVDGLLRGWIEAEHGAAMAFAAIGGMFASVIGGMKRAFADFISGIADNMPSTLIIGDPAGGANELDFSKQISGMKEYANSLREKSSAEKETQATMAEFQKSYEKQIAAHDKIIDDMVKDNTVRFKGNKIKGDEAAAIDNLVRSGEAQANMTAEQSTAYLQYSDIMKGLEEQYNKNTMSSSDAVAASKAETRALVEKKLELAGVVKGTKEYTTAMARVDKYLEGIYSKQMKKAGDKDAAGAHKEAAKAAKEQRAALQELTAGMDVYSASVDKVISRTSAWASSMTKSTEGVHSLYEKYETAGMSEYEAEIHATNKALQEGSDVVANYEADLGRAKDALDDIIRKYEEAQRVAAAYKQALDENKAKGGNMDDKAYLEAQKNVDALAKALDEAGAAYTDAAFATGKARDVQRLMNIELVSGEKAVRRRSEETANDLEKTNSYFNGLRAGAIRLSNEYNTLGKVGVKAFESMTSAVDDFARRSSDVLFDAMTGHLDDAEEEVKASYEQNMKDLQSAYNKGEMTVEEFEKQRVELTEQYNKDIAEAHTTLWEEISGVAGDVWMSLLKELLREFIAWIAKVAAAWAAANIFGGGDWSMPSFGGGGGSGSWGGGGSSDYSSWGTAAVGAGSAVYGWMNDDNIGSGSYGYTDTYGAGSVDGSTYNINNNYIDGVNTTDTFDTSNQDLMNYGSATIDAGKTWYNKANPVVGAPTGWQTLGAGVGAVGGAYGLYSAYNQMQNGTANAGTAVQAGMSAYSLYNSYETLAAAYQAYTAAEAGTAAIEAGTIIVQGTEGAALIASTDATAIGAQSAAAGAASGSSAGAGAASGVSAGTAATGYGIALAATLITAQAMNNHAQETMVSPVFGIPLTMRDYGWDQENDVRKFQGNMVGGFGHEVLGMYTGAEGAQRTYGESGVEGLSTEDYKIAFASFKETSQGTLDILANEFGDGLAQLALTLDGTVASTDRMIDAAAGYDVSMETSANIQALATQAADGSSVAMQQLYDALGSLGITGSAADTAVMGLVASSDQLGGSVNLAADAVGDMINSVNELSATPLHVAIDVDMGDFNAEYYGRTKEDIYGGVGSREAHAVGGIFTGPTLLRSRNGNRHLVGEAGAEAIIPLRYPKQINSIEDDVSALRSEIRSLKSQPIQNYFVVDGKQIATSIMPAVDKHVVAKSQRGQMSVRNY